MARAHFVVGGGDGFQAGGAVAVHGHGRLVFRNAGAQGNDARNVLRVRGLAHAPEDRFVHAVWINPCFGEQRAHRHAAKLHGIEVCKRGTGTTKRRAHTIDNHQAGFHGKE